MTFTHTARRGRSNTVLYAIIVLALVLCFASLAAKAQPVYRMTPIGNESLAILDLNDKGEAVGASTSQGTQRPVLWRRGVLTDLPLLDSAPLTDAAATSINDRSEIVGYNSNASRDIYTGVLWRKGVVQDLGIPDGPFIFPAEINKFGLIAGNRGQRLGFTSEGFLAYEGDSIGLRRLPGHNGTTSVFGMNDFGLVAGLSAPLPVGLGLQGSRAVVWVADHPVDLGTLPDTDSSIAWDINNRLQVVGTSSGPAPSRGWIWDRGRMRELPALDFATSPDIAVSEINDRGEIVGSTRDDDAPGTPSHATLWQKGQVYDLNDRVEPGDPLKPHVLLHNARIINNKGQIVADGRDSRTDGSGTPATAFLLTPIR
jgi:uncharacterized membrane protein